jgi:hypothetical protein
MISVSVSDSTTSNLIHAHLPVQSIFPSTLPTHSSRRNIRIERYKRHRRPNPIPQHESLPIIRRVRNRHTLIRTCRIEQESIAPIIARAICRFEELQCQCRSSIVNPYGTEVPIVAEGDAAAIDSDRPELSVFCTARSVGEAAEIESTAVLARLEFRSGDGEEEPYRRENAYCMAE